MTDRPHRHEPFEAPPSLACNDVSALLASYAAGTLTDRTARAVEWHAAHCRSCEPLLERALAAAPAANSARAITAKIPFDGPEAESLRRRTLARVRPSSAGLGLARTWPLGVGALLAASLLLWTSRSDGTRTAVPADTANAGVDSGWTNFPGATSAPMRSAVRLAREQSAPEFAALDVASRELDLALAAAPRDESLRDFRVVLDARRRELEARVARVTE